MKALLIICLLGLTLSNAFLTTEFSKSDIKTIKSAKSNTSNNAKNANSVDAIESFFKGILSGVGAGDLTDSAACLNKKDADALYKYYLGLASAVGTSSPNNNVNAARAYLLTVGAINLKKVSAQFTKCITASNDYSKVKLALEVDPQSDDFKKIFGDYVVKNSLFFFTVFEKAYENFLSGNFEAAGLNFGRFAASATNYAKRSSA